MLAFDEDLLSREAAPFIRTVQCSITRGVYDGVACVVKAVKSENLAEALAVESLVHEQVYEACSLDLRPGVARVPKPFGFMRVSPSSAVLVMEYCGGVTLDAALRTIGADEERRVYGSVARLLDVLQRSIGFVHGDLHARNVVCGDEVFVLDFGLSRTSDHRTTTPKYKRLEFNASHDLRRLVTYHAAEYAQFKGYAKRRVVRERKKMGLPTTLSEYLDEGTYVSSCPANDKGHKTWHARAKAAYLGSNNDFLYDGVAKVHDRAFEPATFTEGRGDDDDASLENQLANLEVSSKTTTEPTLSPAATPPVGTGTAAECLQPHARRKTLRIRTANSTLSRRRDTWTPE